MKPILLTVTLCLMLGQSALLRAESPTSTLMGRITYAGPIESGQVVAVTRDSSFCGATTTIENVRLTASARACAACSTDWRISIDRMVAKPAMPIVIRIAIPTLRRRRRFPFQMRQGRQNQSVLFFIGIDMIGIFDRDGGFVAGWNRDSLLERS